VRIVGALIVALIIWISSNAGEMLEEDLPCRDVSHGIEKYQYTQLVKESSGRVDGGHDQPWWCQTMKNKFQSTKPNTSIVWSGEKSSEEQPKKDWKGHVTYKYHCTATASWDPLYKLKVSDAYVTVE